MRYVVIKTFDLSDAETQTYESFQELNFPQKFDDGSIFILDDLNEEEMNDPWIQAMFKRSRLHNLSFCVVSQDYYELPEKTIRAT